MIIPSKSTHNKLSYVCDNDVIDSFCFGPSTHSTMTTATVKRLASATSIP